MSIPQPEVQDYPGLRADGDQVPGVEIQLGRFRFLMPPCALADIEEALVPPAGSKASPLDEVAAMLRDGATVTRGGLSVLFDLLTRALKRNYPEVTIDVVKRYLDYGNIKVAIEALYAVNQLTARPTNGAAPSTDASPGVILGARPSTERLN